MLAHKGASGKVLYWELWAGLRKAIRRRKMASSYLRVNLVFNYCTWTSQLSKLGSEIHLCSFMLFLLLSSSWTEDSVKGWMIRAEIFFGRAEEMAALLCLHCFLLLYVHTLLFWLQEQSKVNDLMDLHLGNSIPHSLRSWLHYCLLARNTDTAARYWPCKPNKTSFCFLEQKLSSFIIAPAWLYKSVGKTHPSYSTQNQTTISKVIISVSPNFPKPL